MSLKEIKEAMDNKKICFGLKETLKNLKKSKSKKHKIFVVNDAREETIKKLENIDFVKTKGKEDITKELNLNFECEVFLIK